MIKPLLTLRLWDLPGWLWLLASLAVLALGLMPEWLFPPQVASAMDCPPTLGVLLAGQSALVLLLFPFLRDRLEAGPPTGVAAACAGAILRRLMYMLSCLPLYILAAWFADANAADIVRSLLYLAGVSVGAWGLGRWLPDGDARKVEQHAPAIAMVLAGLLVVLGLPALLYLLSEFSDRGLAAMGLAWVAQVSPLTNGYAVAFAGPEAGWLPQPLWAWLLWPVVGGLAAATRLLSTRPRS